MAYESSLFYTESVVVSESRKASHSGVVTIRKIDIGAPIIVEIVVMVDASKTLSLADYLPIWLTIDQRGEFTNFRK